MTNYQNFRRSLKNLESQHDHYLTLDPSLPFFIQEGMAESVIQRFEICYDSMWKTLRRHLRDQMGLPDVPNSPRPVFRLADENNLLPSPIEQWMEYVDARLGTTHDYIGEKADHARELLDDFIGDSIELYQTLTGEPWE